MTDIKRIRRSPELARQEIIQGAIHCFARDGFHDTSFQKIADHCGMSQTAILYHFKTKSLLLRGALESILVHNATVVAEHLAAEKGSGRKKLEAHFEGNLQWALQHPQEARLISLLYYYASQVPEFTQLYRRIRSHAVKKLQRLIAGKGEYALAAHDLLLGSIVNCMSQGAGPATQKACRKSWEVFLDLPNLY